MSIKSFITAVVLMLLLPAGIYAADLPSASYAAINSALRSGKPTVADFGARTCIPCKRMAPILAELNRELKGKANVLFSDLRESSDLDRIFGIRMIPTQIFFDAKGKEVKRHLGFMDKAEIVKQLRAIGMK